MGHDFHFNSLMEREDLDIGSINDVPIAVAAFFRAPSEVLLHSGFVWSLPQLPPVLQRMDVSCASSTGEYAAPHICLNFEGQSKNQRIGTSTLRRPQT